MIQYRRLPPNRLCAQALHPVSQPPSLMRHCDYDKVIVLLDNDNVEGESMKQQLLRAKGARFTRHREEGHWIFAKNSQGILESIEEPRAGFRRAGLVSGSGLVEFPVGLCLDTDSAHQPRFKRWRARASTSSGSRRVASPERNLLIRRHNSTSQARWISGSAGPSRLARSSRASSARSSRGSAIASSRTLSNAFVLIVEGSGLGCAAIVPQEIARNKPME